MHSFNFYLTCTYLSHSPQENLSHSKRDYLKYEQMMGSFIDNLMFSSVLMRDESSRANWEQLKKNRSSLSCKLESTPQTLLTKKMGLQDLLFLQGKEKKKRNCLTRCCFSCRHTEQIRQSWKLKPEPVSFQILSLSKANCTPFTVFQTNNDRTSTWQEIYRRLLFHVAGFLIKKKKSLPYWKVFFFLTESWYLVY